MDLKSILTHAAALPIADRVALIDELWLTMPEEDDDVEELTEGQKTVIESRDAEFRANRSIALTREEFDSRVRAGR